MSTFPRSIPGQRFAPLWLIVFLGLVAPTVFSYKAYPLYWDESYYAHRILCVNRAVYGGGTADVIGCLSGTHKGMILPLLNLLWGPTGGTEFGVGLAIVSLSITIWGLAVATFLVCLRSGMPGWGLGLAAVTYALAPHLREAAGALMTDTLAGWCTALGLSLILLEYAVPQRQAVSSFLRGLLWGLLFFVGSLARVPFVFLFGLTWVLLVILHYRRSGLKSLLFAVAGSAVGALPALVAWLAFGRIFLEIALQSAWGTHGAPYRMAGGTPFLFLVNYLNALGWAALPVAVLAVLFLRGMVVQKEGRLWRLGPLAVVIAYLAVASGTGSDVVRFLIPVTIGLPISLAWVRVHASPPRWDHWPVYAPASLLAGVLLAIPMVANPVISPAMEAARLLERLTGGKPALILIATDGFSHNIEVFRLAKEIHRDRLRPVTIETIVYDDLGKRPLSESLKHIDDATHVLFLKPGYQPGPSWSRTKEREYRLHAEQRGILLDPATSSIFDVFRIPSNR